MKPKPRRTLVYIEWLDASYQRGECELSDLTPLVVLQSAGLLVREDKQTISIALDYYPNSELWRSIEHIPKINVKRIVRRKI